MATAMVTPAKSTSNAPAPHGSGSGTGTGTFTRVVIIGCAVTENIKRFGITEIARRAGMTRNYTSMILNGLRMPSLSNVIKLATALKCDYNALVGYLDRQYTARNN
jgi:hypothetical protein